MSDLWIGGERITVWKRYETDHGSERIRCRFGLHKIGEQDPYFSLTAEIQSLRGSRWIDQAFGILETEIKRYFPELRKYLRWHLTGIGSPLHYEANGIYFWEQYHGISKWERRSYDPDPLEALYSTIIYDPESDDPIPAPLAIVRDRDMSDRAFELARAGAFVKFLRDRFDRMMGEFRRDMIELLNVSPAELEPKRKGEA